MQTSNLFSDKISAIKIMSALFHFSKSPTSTCVQKTFLRFAIIVKDSKILH